MSALKLGTRTSPLALVQANWVKTQLMQHCKECRVEIVPMKTEGDRLQHVSLSQIGGKGLFIREIENALLRGDIDIAVHSMKDLPTELPPGLIIAAVSPRVDPFDVFISGTSLRLEDLPPRAAIATGSLRRKVQLLHYRDDLVFTSIRGNVDTRLMKLDKGSVENLVLAAAALIRLNRQKNITHYLHPDICLPAAGQGALGIEIRAEDSPLRKLLGPLNDPDSDAAIPAERNCLHFLGVGCHTPAASYAEINGGSMLLKGFVASLDGKQVIKKEIQGPREDGKSLGECLAKEILAEGGSELLCRLYGEQ